MEKVKRKYDRKNKEKYSPDMDIAWESLSSRELQCVYWVIRGYQNEQVGEKLFIESITVERHMGSIYQKTGIAMVDGSAVRKLLWFANRDNMIEHLDSNGSLSHEYLITRVITEEKLLSYQNEINSLKKENANLKNEVWKINNRSVGSLQLSSTELSIAKLIKSGMNNKEIADQLNVTLANISFSCKILKEKLGINDTNKNGRLKLTVELQKFDFDHSLEVLDPKITSVLIGLTDRVGK